MRHREKRSAPNVPEEGREMAVASAWTEAVDQGPPRLWTGVSPFFRNAERFPMNSRGRRPPVTRDRRIYPGGIEPHAACPSASSCGRCWGRAPRMREALRGSNRGLPFNQTRAEVSGDKALARARKTDFSFFPSPSRHPHSSRRYDPTHRHSRRLEHPRQRHLVDGKTPRVERRAGRVHRAGSQRRAYHGSSPAPAGTRPRRHGRPLRSCGLSPEGSCRRDRVAGEI